MIARIIVVRAGNLFSPRIKTFCDAVARVTLLAQVRIARTPDKLFRARDVAVFFLDDLNALADSIVRELAPVRAAADGSQSIQWIPFKRARAITGKIPIGIVG